MRKNEKGLCACGVISFHCYLTVRSLQKVANSSFLVWQGTLVICMEKMFLRLCVDHHHHRFVSLIPYDVPKIHWSALPITDLVQRLHKLTDCIHGLPLKGCPLINCHSCQKACNSLSL